MTREEHLLVILAEECSEVQKAISKSLRFGLNDHEPKLPTTNAEAIAYELADLYALAEMLQHENIIPKVETHLIEDKKKRVEKWLVYSQQNNRLEESK